MKRVISLTLSLTLIASLTAGCGSANDKKSATTSSPTTSSIEYKGTGPITDNKSAKLTILATNSYYTNADLSQAEIIKEVVKRSGVNVEWQLLPPGNYQDAIAPRLAAGSALPDIIKLPDMDPTMKYINGKLFVPIDSYYEKFGVNLKKLYNGEYAGLKASLTTPDKKMYYIPQIGLGKEYQPYFMVNMRWLNNVGLKEPTTIDEFTNMLKAFRNNDPNKNGKQDEIPLSIEKGYIGKSFGPMFGLDLESRFFADKSGKVHFSYFEAAYKDYLTYLNSLYKQGLLDPDFATTTRDQKISRFAKDITGATFDYSWQMSQSYSNQFKDYDGKTPIVKGIAPVKNINGDQYYVGRNVGTGIFGISRDCKDPELAFKFLDFAISDEAQTLYNWGVEGVTYNVVDGKKVYTDKGKDNDFIQKYGINPVNMPSIQSTAMAEGILPAWHVQVDKQISPMVKAPWPAVYSLPEEASVESQYLTDLNTYIDEMEMKFILGTESLANFDKYKDKLKNMHVDELLKVRQAQYDRYVASSKK